MDSIVVWVSRDPYLSDEGIADEPLWAEKIRLSGTNLIFKWVKNTGPYRKLFPALKAATEDDILIYADDDAIYNESWAETLLTDFFNHNQQCVVAARVRKTVKKKKDILDSYRNFPLITTSKVIDTGYIITGLGGVVLKKNMIPTDFHHNEDFLTICPRADDIWISKLIQLTKTPVYVSSEAISYVHEIIHDYGLSRLNTSKIKRSLLHKVRLTFKSGQNHYLCQNDMYIQKTDNYFESYA